MIKINGCHEKACLSPNSTAAPAATVVAAIAFCQNEGDSLLAAPSAWTLLWVRFCLLKSVSTTSRNPSCVVKWSARKETLWSQHNHSTTTLVGCNSDKKKVTLGHCNKCTQWSLWDKKSYPMGGGGTLESYIHFLCKEASHNSDKQITPSQQWY